MFLYSNHFMRDYLGNVRYVSGIYQYNDYDPLGKIIYSSNLDKNVYLYEGKERIPDLAEEYKSVYDFGARYYNPLYGRWFAPDPAKQGINPYVYCGNNPVQLVDPDGRIWIDPDDFNYAIESIKARIKTLERQNERKQKMIDKGNLSEAKSARYDSAIKENEAKIGLLNKGLDAANMMEADTEHYYRFESTSEQFSRVRQGDNNNVYIQGPDFGFQLHEMIHVMQSLTNNGLQFGNDDFLKNAYTPEHVLELNEKTQEVYSNMSRMEVEAYKVQCSYNGYFPLSNVSFNGINVHTVGDIMNGGVYVYGYIKEYSNYLKTDAYIRKSELRNE